MAGHRTPPPQRGSRLNVLVHAGGALPLATGTRANAASRATNCYAAVGALLMAVSILEALMNAEHNLKLGIPAIKPLAMDQLHNAIVLLEKGYGSDTEVEPLLEQHGSVDDVPEAA